MANKTAKDYKNDYTKPELRERLKEEMKSGSKGGRVGQWTEEDWQTADNKIAIRGKETVRYLPKKVWQQLSASELQLTNRLKVTGSRRGKQIVDNPREVKAILKSERKKYKK